MKIEVEGELSSHFYNGMSTDTYKFGKVKITIETL